MKRVLGTRPASVREDVGKSSNGVPPSSSSSSSFSSSLLSSLSSNPPGDDSTITTNVQVCARIRPLIKSSPSKPTRRLSFIPGGNSRSPRKSGPFSDTRTTYDQSNVQDDGDFVAWDISRDRRTASQSDRTEKIQGRTHSYTLDRLFGSESTTHEIYDESVASLVKAAMEGYNSTVLAYGQTSTGKTHTMTGKQKAPGLIPLCVRDCFNYIQDNPSAESREYLFRFSYLEIYKENIRDLLSSSSSASEPVRLFDGPNGLIIRGLKEEVVSSPEKVFKLLRQGEKRRQVGATHMNQHSSRSHAVMRLKIESSSTIDRRDRTRVSLLSLVDLAGSESVRLNGVERRDEGQYINKSLMALGQCVLGLSESSKSEGGKKINRSHIPFRDSKLTRMLQSSLSGNAKMLLMCCISPLASHMEESHNTFKFATRAKRIEQTATIQTAGDKEETLLQTYRDEIEDLKKQLAEAAEQKQTLLNEQREYQAMKERQNILQSTEDEIEVVATLPPQSDINNIITSNTMESTTEEIEELVEAIQTMEHLILKSRSLQQRSSSNPEAAENNDTILETNSSCDSEKLEDFLDYALESSKTEDLLVDNKTCAVPSSTNDVTTSPLDPKSMANTEDKLHSELTRIRGLLGSVLQKRGVPSKIVRKSLDFSTPARGPLQSRNALDQSLSDELEVGTGAEGNINEGYGTTKEDAEEKKAELESLRMQLEQQERTTSLRKADSHFLQRQLEEKDMLLEEVSSLLEAVERRQGELERENFALKVELSRLRDEKGFEV